jgi:hypothetical protein
MSSDCGPVKSAAGRPTVFSRGLSLAALGFVYYLAAAASFSGYFGKWAFRDGNPTYGVASVFDGTAARPFIYRQLMPVLADSAATIVDEIAAQPTRGAAFQALGSYMAIRAPDEVFSQAGGVAEPKARRQYFALYYLTFVSFVATLFAMRGLCLRLGQSEAAATLAPLLFALIYPVLLTQGGYYYDVPEFLFLCFAVTLALQGRWPWLLILSVPATLNKEAYLFFIPTLYPLLRAHMPRNAVCGVLGAALCLSLVTSLAVKYQFRENEGVEAFFQLRHHVGFFLDWRPYVRMETNYGVPTAAGFHVLHLVLMVGLCRVAWPLTSPVMKRHATLAAVINLPLFALFAYKDELRNLSFLFPTVLVMMACWLSAWLAGSAMQPLDHAGPQPERPG